MPLQNYEWRKNMQADETKKAYLLDRPFEFGSLHARKRRADKTRLIGQRSRLALSLIHI